MPHSYIQLSITSNKSFAQWKNKLCSAAPACPTGAGSGRHTWATSSSSSSPCFVARPIPDQVCCVFGWSCWFGPYEYGMLQQCSILPLVVPELCSPLRGSCFPSLPTSVSLDAVPRWSHIPDFLPWGYLSFSKPAQPVIPYQARIQTEILQNEICSKLHFERELLPAPSSERWLALPKTWWGHRLQAKSSYKTIVILEKNPDLPEDNLLPLIGPEKALSNNTLARVLTAAFSEKMGPEVKNHVLVYASKLGKRFAVQIEYELQFVTLHLPSVPIY